MPKVSSERREQYLQERRDQIIDASIKVFGAKGFAGTNVADIAREAGIGKGTLYLYFKSKEDIFNSILTERSFVPRLETLLQVNDQPVEEVLTKIARAYLDYVPQFIPLFMLAIAEYYRFPEHSYQMFADIVQSGIEKLAEYLQTQVDAGRLHNIDKPVDVSRAFIGMLASFIISEKLLELSHSPSITEDEWVKEVVHLFLKGVEG